MVGSEVDAIEAVGVPVLTPRVDIANVRLTLRVGLHRQPDGQPHQPRPRPQGALLPAATPTCRSTTRPGSRGAGSVVTAARPAGHRGRQADGRRATSRCGASSRTSSTRCGRAGRRASPARKAAARWRWRIASGRDAWPAVTRHEAQADVDRSDARRHRREARRRRRRSIAPTTWRCRRRPICRSSACSPTTPAGAARRRRRRTSASSSTTSAIRCPTPGRRRPARCGSSACRRPPRRQSPRPWAAVERADGIPVTAWALADLVALARPRGPGHAGARRCVRPASTASPTSPRRVERRCGRRVVDAGLGVPVVAVDDAPATGCVLSLRRVALAAAARHSRGRAAAPPRRRPGADDRLRRRPASPWRGWCSTTWPRPGRLGALRRQAGAGRAAVGADDLDGVSPIDDPRSAPAARRSRKSGATSRRRRSTPVERDGTLRRRRAAS